MREQVAERERRLSDVGTRCGLVAVVSGDGLRNLYEELGATVVDGGPTMNPSTDELLAGIHSVGAEGVLVLPNSPNVVLAAEHAAELSDRDAEVLDCTSQQAGLVAMVELDPAAIARGERRPARPRPSPTPGPARSRRPPATTPRGGSSAATPSASSTAR